MNDDFLSTRDVFMFMKYFEIFGEIKSENLVMEDIGLRLILITSFIFIYSADSVTLKSFSIVLFIFQHS